ncbi:hypothetical protein BX600DRAFT_416530 [Xylariales sp. PMI_506]|nr:hypothetical protein BX600DRAFT_416530 [Xylariales sp. PMI_506]
MGLQVLSLIPGVWSQDYPLFTQGGLEGAVATDDSFNSGGTISLNGIDITVPKNMLVQFPAAYVPWQDFVAQKDNMLGYEINVVGNFINNVPIAAQIIAFEFFENLSSGFIESINFEEGSMKIRAGPTLRINDPNGVFSVGYEAAPFFTADDQNPSISSFSGFPMCIPRNATDPLCPANNRPFQGSGTFNAPDPLSMAPFLPGDFVTYSGIRRGDELICYSIVAENVQITTLQDVVYIRVESIKSGISNFNTNTELTESRFVGFVSNPRASVAIYAQDYDPCTGAVTDRVVANPVAIKGGAAGNEQNRFDFREDIVQGYARDYRIAALINGAPVTNRTTKNGLRVGSYISPVTVWVQAEQLIPGTQPPANDFSQMPWLTEGVGRVGGSGDDSEIWGPLQPFPQTGVLIDTPVCT